jgi:hypothetical protein
MFFVAPSGLFRRGTPEDRRSGGEESEKTLRERGGPWPDRDWLLAIVVFLLSPGFFLRVAGRPDRPPGVGSRPGLLRPAPRRRTPWRRPRCRRLDAPCYDGLTRRPDASPLRGGHRRAASLRGLYPPPPDERCPPALRLAARRPRRSGARRRRRGAADPAAPPRSVPRPRSPCLLTSSAVHRPTVRVQNDALNRIGGSAPPAH